MACAAAATQDKHVRRSSSASEKQTHSAHIQCVPGLIRTKLVILVYRYNVVFAAL